jgi:hypothetical protein
MDETVGPVVPSCRVVMAIIMRRVSAKVKQPLGVTSRPLGVGGRA